MDRLLDTVRFGSFPSLGDCGNIYVLPLRQDVDIASATERERELKRGVMNEPKVEVPDQVIARGAESAAPVPPSDDRNTSENLVEAVTEPGKVMRIGSMVKQLLDEVRGSQLDVGSRERLAEIYERSIVELAEAISPDLQEELRMLALPFNEEVPSEAELRVAQAQLVGWLEGLFHGIQATLFAQQMAARQQFDQMRQIGQPQGENSGGAARPGTYL